MLLLKNKFTRLLLALLIIYIAWSVLINLVNLDKNINEEALVPCLFLLPPVGFLLIGVILAKFLESAIVVGVVRRIAHRKNRDKPKGGAMPYIIAALGIASLGIFLSYFNIADLDLWARLVQGASIWNTGHLIHKDIFAFTPVLGEYIDHEWGSGLIFFTLLKLFGPASLLLLKVMLGVTALSFAIAVGRLFKVRWTTLFFLAIPCALTIFPGYEPVVRSHAFTYPFFAITLLCLEAVRRGKRWPAFIVVIIMALWTNLHGGFVSGLGIITLYALEEHLSGRKTHLIALTLLFAVLSTFINPYGIKLWGYLIPALLMARSSITEWAPMPLFGPDIFFGFRILFVMAAIFVIAGWRKVNERPLEALILIITAYLAFRHMRHAPFFGLASAAFLGIFLESALDRVKKYIPAVFNKVNFMAVTLAAYLLITAGVILAILPMVRWNVITPSVFFPVRPVDILLESKAKGNLVISFGWGNYAMWRLHPNVKISICGRYEAMYPESTFLMNEDFFLRKGNDWDRMFRQCKVDFIIFNFTKVRPRPEDIDKLGFDMVWTDGYSALFARKELVPALREAEKGLPPASKDPLDARIPDGWWKQNI